MVEAFTGYKKWGTQDNYMASSRVAYFRRKAWDTSERRSLILNEARRRALSSGVNTRAFLVQLLSTFFLAGVMLMTMMTTPLGASSSGTLRLVVGVAIWLSVLVLQVVGYLDILFNLIEDKETAQHQLRAVRQALFLHSEEPGRLWSAIFRAVRGRGAWVPMTASAILDKLLWGFPAGSIMISYRWGPVGDSELPRKVAKMLNGHRLKRLAWLDVDELIPGMPCLEAEQEAVSTATFRIVFLSAQYLVSTNCQSELAMLEHEPGRTLFLVYTSQHSDQGKKLAPPIEATDYLKAQGHLVQNIDSFRVFGPGLLLSTLIESTAMASMLAERSPRINDQWSATARALCERPRLCERLLVAMKRFGYILLIPIIANLGVLIFIDYYVHKTVTLDLVALHASLR